MMPLFTKNLENWLGLIGYKFVTYPFQTLNLKYRLLLVTKS